MKRIGIPAWTFENGVGIGTSYAEFISKFGKMVIITPQDMDDPPEVDLLILPGGVDILPNSYGALPSYRTGKASPLLEHFDENIFPQYLERETPIFGICRGMQLIWSHFGGDIVQHNGWHRQSAYANDQCHELFFTKGHEELKLLVNNVTSRHHQTCDATDSVPDELEVIAYAQQTINKKEYHWEEIVEVVRHKTLPIIGVQYHPEDHDASDELSPFFINDLLNN